MSHFNAKRALSATVNSSIPRKRWPYAPESLLHVRPFPHPGGRTIANHRDGGSEVSLKSAIAEHLGILLILLSAFAIPLSAVVLLVRAVAASSQVNFPIGLQLPPVARVGEAYSFQFAPTTFQPGPDRLIYSLIGNPSWLHITSGNRTLWGAPGSGDVGALYFTIAAAGGAGAVANMESKLMVTNEPAPKLNGNVSQQLSTAGQLSGPQSIMLLPSKPFEVTFAPDLFQSTGNNLTYHATLADHTPLPSWISFNAQALRFAGTPPPSPTPEQFEVLLIASDVPGFATASVSFTLIVSNHQLLFKPLEQTLNISKGTRVHISGLKEKLFLDNSPIQAQDVQSAHAELPSWLFFDDHTFDLSGDPPQGLMSQDLSITVQDRFGNTAKHSIHLMFASPIFTSEAGQLNITAGQDFEYKIPKTILSQGNESVSMEFGELSQWLKFDPGLFMIQGRLPDNLTTRTIEGSLTATSADGKLKDTQSFQIQVTGTEPPTQAGDVPSTPLSDQPVETWKGSTSHSSPSGGRRAGVVAGSVISGVLAAIILLAFICLLRRRKRHEKGYISPKTPRSPQKTDISRPIPIAELWRELDGAFEHDVEKGKDDESLNRTPEHPPQLGLDLPKRHKESHSPTSSIREYEDKIFTEFKRCSFGYQDEAGPSHRPHDSMKIPTEIARRESASSPLKHKRRTAHVYKDPQHRSSGLPVNRRLSGLGHGWRTSSSPQTKSVTGYRRPLSSRSLSGASDSVSVRSTTPSACTKPSLARHTMQLTMPAVKRRSVRLMTASTCDSILDHRTVDEKRSSYFSKRNSARSPFFGATSSRVSSAGYKTPYSFISDPSPITKTALAPLSANIVKPSDDIIQPPGERELTESPSIRKPTDTPSPVTKNSRYPRSLRKKPSERCILRRYTEAPAASSRDRAVENYSRPGTASHTQTGTGHQPSTQKCLLAAGVKSSLNMLTNSEIYEDAEASGSEYPDEEIDFEEASRRTTLKPNQFTLPPLVVNRGRPKQTRKHGTTGEVKHTSERDPTPYPLALEHGGKENHSSTFSLAAHNPSSTRPQSNRTSTVSPKRPKPAVGLRHKHTSSQTRPLSRHSSHKPHLSTSPIRKTRPRVRTQSSSYPRVDAPPTPSATGPSTSTTTATTTRQSAAVEPPTSTSAPRPKLRLVSTQRASRPAQLDSSPFFHSKRDTAIPARAVSPVGLGLYSGAGVEGGGLGEEMGVRLVEGKGKRPVSVEVDEESGRAVTGKGRSGGSVWGGREVKAFL